MKKVISRLTLCGFAMTTMVATSVAQGPSATDREGGDLTKTSEGFHFFNKPGATIERHDEELIDCFQAGRFLDQPKTTKGGGSGGIIGAIATGIGSGMSDARFNRRGIAANIENCMIVKGWRVIGVSDDVGERLDDLDDKDIRPEIIDWIGQENPDGVILRAPFRNELNNGDLDIDLAQKAGESSLSVRATIHIARDVIDRYYGLDDYPPTENPRFDRPLKEPKGSRSNRAAIIKLKKLADANPDSSYIVFRVSGFRNRGTRSGPEFIRLNEDGMDRANDKRAWKISASGRRSNFDSNRDDGQFSMDFIAEIPSGEWALSAITREPVNGLRSLVRQTTTENIVASLCLGMPTFNVGPGEVIYAGHMQLPETGGFPLITNDIENARSVLNANATLAARLKPAEYTNGARTACTGAFMFAYEVEEAPFRQAYVWGSKAPTLLSKTNADEGAEIDINPNDAAPVNAQPDSATSTDW